MFGGMMNYPLTLVQIMAHANRVHGDKQVHTLLPDGKVRRYSYAALACRVKRLANALTGFGIQCGDAVATYAGNTYQHLELYYAIPCVGAILHPLNVRLAPAQLAKIVKQADDKLIFVDGIFAEQFSKLQDKIGDRRVVLFNADTPQHQDLRTSSIAYEDCMSAANDSDISHILDENWAMGLCYTSGTSGEPKGVLYTHRSMYLHTLAVNQTDVFGLTESDVVLLLVPMFHAMGWGLPYACPFVGADIVLPGFVGGLSKPSNVGEVSGQPQKRIVDLIAETGVTVAAGVPTVWRYLFPELQKKKTGH